MRIRRPRGVAGQGDAGNSIPVDPIPHARAARDGTRSGIRDGARSTPGSAPDVTGALPCGTGPALGATSPVPGVAGPVPGVAAPAGPLADTRLSKEIRQLLSSLGRTRGDVAASLEAAGVRATPKDPRHSPVALFLAAVVGADPNVKAVSIEGADVVVELRAWWRPRVVVALPAVMREFSAAFDACCYPTLLPPGHRAE